MLAGPSEPRSITVDHGTEFQSRAREDRASLRDVHLDFLCPNKPVRDDFIEAVTDGCAMNASTCISSCSLPMRKPLSKRGGFDYNLRCPHSSLGHLTPNEFVGQRQVILATEEAVWSSEESSRNGANVNALEALF